MEERTRRLRMGLAHSSPGASGDMARPNYVGPSGNGLVERRKAGETPWNQGRSNGRPCPFPEGGPEYEGKTPQWSAARRAGPRYGPAVPSRRRDRPDREAGHVVRRSAPAPFGAPLPHVWGARKSRRTPRLARTGAAELWLSLRAGCLKRESDDRARKRRRAFWRNEP